MQNMIDKMLQLVPRKLPVGKTEFEKFATRVINIAGKFADEDSMKFAIASILMHAGESRGRLSDSYFVTRLRKTAANQVAGQIFVEVKERQAKRQAEEMAAKQQAEATAAQETVASDVIKEN